MNRSLVFLLILLVPFPILSAFQGSLGAIEGVVMDQTGAALPGVSVTLTNRETGLTRVQVTSERGVFRFIGLDRGEYNLKFELAGFSTLLREGLHVGPGKTVSLQAALNVATITETITVTGESPRIEMSVASVSRQVGALRDDRPRRDRQRDFNTESYSHFTDNPFERVRDHARSTFGIDVDTASYSNVRRFLRQGEMPPPDSVRIEEMINYFTYAYPEPSGSDPVAVSLERAACPWQPEHDLVRIALKAKEVSSEAQPQANLVFLLDVSGSMQPPEKLPLVKRALRMLVARLRDTDRVSIVVYAGAEGLVLPPTPGSEKETILNAIEGLEAGGTTNGGAGIELAYNLASRAWLEEGSNRVLLATDGDFNVGVTNEGDLVRLIQEKAKKGIFLSVFGFGMGNYKDSTLEKLADKGNGNYAYVDTLTEARKVFVEQLTGTLFTVAKDVKIQVEFNPAEVEAYRLIGYENRRLADEDFNDDAKDAGDMGAGHTVTALYEIVPTGKKLDLPTVDPLKYQEGPTLSRAARGGEILTVKMRYKEPRGGTSQMLAFALRDGATGGSSADFKFSTAVALFGMILRNSAHKGDGTIAKVRELARAGAVDDTQGHRREFIELIEAVAQIQEEERLLAKR